MFPKTDRPAWHQYTLVLLLIALAVAYAVVAFWLGWRDERAHRKQDIQHLAHQIAERTDLYFAGWKGVLGALASHDCFRVRSAAICGELLPRLQRRFPDVEGVVAADRDGKVFASGVPRASAVTGALGGLPFFRSIAGGRQSFLIDPHAGTISPGQVIGLAVPLHDLQGAFDGVFVVTLPFANLERILQESLPVDSGVLVLGQSRQVILASAANAEWKGLAASELKLWTGDEPDEGPIRFEYGRQRYYGYLHHVGGRDWAVISYKRDMDMLSGFVGEDRLGLGLFLPLALLALLAGALSLRSLRLTARLQKNEAALRAQHDELEQTVSRRTAELSESRERYRAVLEQAPDSIVVIDAESGRIIEFNRHAHELLGYTAEEFEQIAVSDIEAVEDAEQVANHIAEIVRAGHATFETRHRRHDGELLDILVNVHVALLNGRSCLFAIWSDLTERKRAQRERIEAQARLIPAQKLEAVGLLAGGIAHHFNNLLAVIHGYGQLIRDSVPVGSAPHDSAERINAAALRARDLVLQLLEFSRDRDVSPQRIALAPLVRGSENLLRTSLPSIVSLNFTAIATPGWVFAVPQQVQQVLFNLVVNASEAIGDKDGLIEVSLSTVEVFEPIPAIGGVSVGSGSWVVLRVEDNGPGIARDQQEHVFLPFFTTKETGRGTGLGLAVVRSIVGGNGGYVRLSERNGGGACFEIYWPSARVHFSAGALDGAASSARRDSAIESDPPGRKVFEHLADAVMILSRNEIIDCNPAAVSIFGAGNRDEILSLRLAELSPKTQSNGEDSELAMARRIEQAFATGGAVFESLHRRLDSGKYFVGKIRLTRIEVEGLPLIQAEVRDITRRSEAYPELRANEELFRVTFESASIGVCLVGLDGCFIKVNRRFCEMLGYDRLALEGRAVSAVTHPDSMDVSPIHFQRALAGEIDAAEFEKKYVHRQGHTVWAQASMCLVYDTANRPLYFVSHVHDITARKQAEQALRESEELFRAVFQSASDAIVTADASGRIIKWNQGAEHVFGYSHAEIVGQNVCVLIPQRLRDRHCNGMTRFLAGNEPQIMGRAVELSGLRKDGAEFPLELSLAQWQGADGHLFSAVIRDITLRKRIENELVEQRDQLEHMVQQRTLELSTALEAAKLADQTKDAFLSTMSHELRTPLNAVIGMADLARGLSTDAKQRDYLDKIARSGKHLSRLINDLLDLSRIAAGEMTVETVGFSLRSVVERCLGLMSATAAGKGLQLVQTIAPDVPDSLLGDPLRIEQILLNLLGNAIKFTATGRVELRVRGHARESDRVCLDIAVEDTGIGIRNEDIAHLFLPFAQADATVSRKFGGSGLGLAISRRLAELMGGEIDVRSREGVGSTFTLRIWFSLSDTATINEPITSSVLHRHYENVCVVVADDQPINREIVEALLVAVGITPRLAENGQQVIDVLGELGPDACDLVLMDLEMPVMDGLSATRFLRQQPEFASLPIIAMTAHTMTHDKENVARAGMSDHIGKPFDRQTFYRTLARWLPAAKPKASHVLRAFTGKPGAQASPAAVGALGPLPGVDIDATLQRMGGREDRLRKWLADFVGNAAAIPVKIRRELAAGHAERAADVVHAFKGRVGMLGMIELHDLLVELEAGMRDGKSVDRELANIDLAIHTLRGRLVIALGQSTAAGPGGVRVRERIVWSAVFSVGVPEMDEQHKKLLGLINRLAECMDEHDSAGFHEVLYGMFDYTQVHFAAEKEFMQRIGFPELHAHDREHSAFVERMSAFSLAASDGIVDMDGVRNFLKEWLLAHILQSDMQYRHFLEGVDSRLEVSGPAS